MKNTKKFYNLEVPFEKEISSNYSKAKSAYEHSEACRKNRATRRKIVTRLRKEAWMEHSYFALFCVCLFFINFIILRWTI